MPKIATWNVNSIKARLPNVLDWLRQAEPDAALLQEIKCQDEAFPRLEIEALGYHCAVHGQKSYNGVAILSKEPLSDVSSRLPGDDADDHARYLEATAFGIRLACLYLPNGNPAPGDKYDYKLAWMARLAARAEALLATEQPVVMAGDYNVIPEPEDCHDPKVWAKDALFLPDTRRAFRRLLWLGYTDAFRALHGEPHRYTFWDYQGGAWQADEGIRIDHLLLSPQATDRLSASGIDRDVRGREKASDHVPAWCVID